MGSGCPGKEIAHRVSREVALSIRGVHKNVLESTSDPPGFTRLRGPVRRDPGCRLRCPALRGQCHHLRPERVRVRPEHAGRRRREDRERHLLEDGDEPVRPRALCAALQAGHVRRHLQRRLLHPRGRAGAEPRRRPHRRRRERQRQVGCPTATRRDNFWRTLENFAVTPSSDVPYRPPRASRGSRSPRPPRCGACTSRANCSCSTGARRGTWATPAAGSWPTRSWTARSSPPRSSSGSPATASGPSWSNAVWNMVFVGCDNTPAGTFPNPPYTVVDRTPVIREKPYLFVDGSGEYRVFVPALQTDARGVSWLDGPTPGESIPIDRLLHRPARRRRRPRASTPRWPRASTSCSRPGVYSLDDTLRVTRADTILLGLGVPSLIPTKGLPILSVADVDGVKIAGLILDAGPVKSPTPPGGRPRGQQGRSFGQPHLPLRPDGAHRRPGGGQERRGHPDQQQSRRGGPDLDLARRPRRRAPAGRPTRRRTAWSSTATT